MKNAVKHLQCKSIASFILCFLESNNSEETNENHL